jgi:hypothetical protein
MSAVVGDQSLGNFLMGLFCTLTSNLPIINEEPGTREDAATWW